MEIGETMREFRRLGRLLARQAHRIGTEKVHRIQEIISRAYKEIEVIIEE